MADGPDYILDLGGCHMGEADAAERKPSRTTRPWLGIHFDCCDVYARVYRNRTGSAYRGHCPKCGRPVHIRVGDGGTTARFFRAT